MREWIIAGWLHLIIGFVLGWAVFKRPAMVDNFIVKVRTKLGI